jgi:hypothetical protein
MSQAYPIQQGLWESLDAVLFNKALALAKDIAVDLNVPAQALIDLLKKEERGKFMILPDDTMLYQCNALIQRGAILTRCRCTTLGITQTCNAHHSVSSDHTHNPSLSTVQRLIAPDSVYYTTQENSVYTLNGEQCGILDGSTLTLFVIES